MSREYPCPACGAPVRFQSSASIFAVCASCAQMLVRRDVDVEAVGKMATLPEDSSPLQVGSEGRFDGNRFTLLGRLRQGWSDGNWNEWFALFDDGRHGWLAEAQGFLMMSFDRTDESGPDGIPPRTALRPGLRIMLGTAAYEVGDIKDVTCVGSEGELPFRAPRGRQATSVDLAAPGKGYACLDYSAEGTRAYVGRYVDFDELDLKNLRELDGW